MKKFNLKSDLITAYKNQITIKSLASVKGLIVNLRNGTMVIASALQSVDLGLVTLLSYTKDFENVIYCFPAWCSAIKSL